MILVGATTGAGWGALMGQGAGRVIKGAADCCVGGSCYALENAAETGLIAGALTGASGGTLAMTSVLVAMKKEQYLKWP